MDNGKRFAITYPLSTYLSVGWLYPLFIQLRLDPGIFFSKKSLRFDRSKKDYSISKTGDECLSENNYQPAVVRGRHSGKIDVMFTLSLISTRLSHLNIDKLF